MEGSSDVFTGSDFENFLDIPGLLLGVSSLDLKGGTGAGEKATPKQKKIKLVELMKQSHGNRKRHSQVQFQEPKKRPGAMFILAVRISLG